jgi:hypothetical protein
MRTHSQAQIRMYVDLPWESVVFDFEILDSLTATTPEQHGRSAGASDFLKRSEQHSDMDSLGKCIEVDEGLMSTGEDSRDVPPSTMHGELATNQSFHV